MRLYLVGFMGAGKSTIGRQLARRLDWAFWDLDHEIERSSGMSIAALIGEFGEAEFRRREAAMVLRSALVPRLVVATGGGAFAQPHTHELIQQAGISLFLDLPFPVLARRVESSPRARPLFADRERAFALWQARLPWYEKSRVHLRLDEHDDLDSAVEKIVEALKDPCVI